MRSPSEASPDEVDDRRQPSSKAFRTLGDGTGRPKSGRLMRRSVHMLDGSLDVSPAVLDRLDV
jgi:hypothetical protein